MTPTRACPDGPPRSRAPGDADHVIGTPAYGLWRAPARHVHPGERVRAGGEARRRPPDRSVARLECAVGHVARDRAPLLLSGGVVEAVVDAAPQAGDAGFGGGLA